MVSVAGVLAVAAALAVAAVAATEVELPGAAVLGGNGALRALTAEQQAIVDRASRSTKAGWVQLKLSGTPYEVGLQHGSLAAKEYATALCAYEHMTLETTGMPYTFFRDSAVTMQKHLVPAELLDEMRGIADGIASSGIDGVQHTTLDDIIGWNAYQEMTGYWWPQERAKRGFAEKPAGIYAKAHCSAFIATGTATKDGRPVVGHQTFTEFWNGQFFNFILDITPKAGQRMIMQASPGFVSSMTDFWVTSSLIVTETTIVGYSGYDAKKIPEWVRIREAVQYQTTIDGFADVMRKENNGGYANSWLVAEVKTGTIGSLELGIIYTNLTKKTNGYIAGFNGPTDPRIRNLECNDVGYTDVRQQVGARRVRWPQLLDGNFGNITLANGQAMLGDTWDPYLKKENPSGRCICSHYDVDPAEFVSDPSGVWNVPFCPAGSVDGKAATAAMAEKVQMSGRFGRADGVAFDADAFLKEHPQWIAQKGYLQSRPSQPWATFPV